MYNKLLKISNKMTIHDFAFSFLHHCLQFVIFLAHILVNVSKIVWPTSTPFRDYLIRASCVVHRKILNQRQNVQDNKRNTNSKKNLRYIL